MSVNALAIISAIAVNIIAIIAGIYAAVRWLRSWLRKQISESRSQIHSDDSSFRKEIAEDMSSHMTTIGRRFNYVDEQLESLVGIYVRISELDEWSSIVDKRITQANDVALIALRRLDEIERNKNDA